MLIPSNESGALLQRKDFQVSLQASGEGAEVKLELQTLLRGGALQSWIPISPSSNALISASADGKVAITDVRNGWHMVWVEGAGEHIIRAQTRAQVDRSSGQPRLRLSPQAAPRSKLTLSLPGEREVTTEPSVPVTSLSMKAPLSPVKTDIAETNNIITQVSADLPPLETIVLRWTEKRVTPEEESPEFLSETYQLFELQEGLLKGQARVELDIIKGELKRLEVEVPAEVVLYHLNGIGVESWVTLPHEGDSDPSTKRVLVTFGEPRSGKSDLAIKWQRVLSNKEALSVPVIRPLGAFQESGVIALYDGDRVGFTPAKAELTANGEERLIPVGQESIPQRILQLKTGEKVSQAFRHVQAPTELKTSTTTERARELRFDAQLDTLYSLRDGAIRAQSQLLLNLKSGRLETLTLRLPSTCSEPQVSGPSINRVEPLKAAKGDDPAIKRYQIRFTRRLEGAVTLNIDAERLISSESTELSLPRIVVEGAEITQGHIGLTAEAGLEVSPEQTDELRRVTIDELPRSITLRSATELLYGYRFSREWTLETRLKRHKIIETLNAEIIFSQLETFLLESGQRVDLAKYTIINRDRRDLKLTLPPHSDIQEVLINDSPVRARAEGKQISIPLPKNQQLDLVLRYEVARDTHELNRYHLIAPSSDIRTTNITWELFFSPQYQLWSWEGDLKKINTYTNRINPEQSFSSLKHQTTFSYDLLSPNHQPLHMRVSLRGIVSDQVMNRLSAFAFIALLLIGLRRGLMFAGKSILALKYPELASLLVLSINAIIMLYQSSLSELEWMSFFALKTVLVVAFISAISLKIYHALSSIIARRSIKPPQKSTSVVGESDVVTAESVSQNEVFGSTDDHEGGSTADEPGAPS